jgi:hypothetical protein
MSPKSQSDRGKPPVAASLKAGFVPAGSGPGSLLAATRGRALATTQKPGIGPSHARFDIGNVVTAPPTQIQVVPHTVGRRLRESSPLVGRS